MGEVIRANAAVDDIRTDVNLTVSAAIERGGLWESEALRVLAPSADLTKVAHRAWTDARLRAVRSGQALAAAERRADLAVGSVRDLLWNRLERAADDATLALLFPRGVRAITGADPLSQADRMETVAELLEETEDDRLDASLVASLASTLRDAARFLRDAARDAETTARALSRAAGVYRGRAQAARAKLAALKRVYRAHGRSEADIHRVIPDRKVSGAEVLPAAVVTEGAPVVDTAAANAEDAEAA